MMKRSFLAVAAGLVASLALSAPSHAGTVTVTGSWSVPGAVASQVDFDFTAPVGAPITVVGSPATPTPTFSGNEVIFTYSPAIEGASLTFTVTTTGSFLGGQIDTATIVGTPTSNNFNFAPASSTPEPNSIALLGIGVTGLLAFRRLFKRNKPVA